MALTNDKIYEFNHYWISSFYFNDIRDKDVDINYAFTPTGLFDEDENHYIVILELSATYTEEGQSIEDGEDIQEDILNDMDGDDIETDKEIEFISVTLEASFTLKENQVFDRLPISFFEELINTLFPHLRSFLAATTQLANVEPILLPVWGMGDSGAALRDNTEIILQQ